MKNLKKYLGIFGFVLFLLIIFKIGINNILSSIFSANPIYILLSIIPLCLVIIIQSMRWQLIIKTVGSDIPLLNAIILFLKSYFLGAITPGKIGDFYRSKLLSEQKQISIGLSFYTVFIDRICDIFTIIVISIMGLLFITEFKNNQQFFIFFVLAIVGIGGILGYLIFNRDVCSKFIYPLIERFVPLKYKENFKFSYDEFYVGYKHLFKDKFVFFKIITLSVIIWLIAGLGFYLLSISLGFGVSYWYILTSVLLGTLVSLIPISINGLGTREAVIIFLFSIVMISPELAMAFSLLCLIWNYLPIVPSLILYHFSD